jgi:hypothetical protein
VAGPRRLAFAHAQFVNIIVANLAGLLEEARLLRDLSLEVPEIVVAFCGQFDFLNLFGACEKCFEVFRLSLYRYITSRMHTATGLPVYTVIGK